MIINAITNKIICLQFDDHNDLVNTFLRPTEYHESPRWRNKIFTLGQYRRWFCREYGSWCYAEMWSGFNVPDYALKPFINGLFDPLTPEEQKLIDLVRYRYDKFYVIGVSDRDKDGDVKKHEICHGLYYTDPEYKNSVEQVFNTHQDSLWLCELELALSKRGYADHVLRDEIHVHTMIDHQWVMRQLNIIIPSIIIEQMQNIRKQFWSPDQD